MIIKDLFEMATVKLPSQKIQDEIVNFVLLSYLKRNKYNIPKRIKSVKYTKDGQEDIYGIEIPKKELPYNLDKDITLMIIAAYKFPEYEAVVYPILEVDDMFSMEFFLKAPYYTMEKDNIENLEHKIRSNIRHEFTHLIQNYLVADKGDVAKAKTKLMRSKYGAASVNYLTSPVEFEAFIYSKIDEFIKMHKKYTFKSQQDLNDQIKKYIQKADFFRAYATAIKRGTTRVHGTVDNDEDKAQLILDYPSLRKRAIKKFYASPEIQELIHD